MELNEIEVLVGEAETRVERLRSLYDQYFMGLEKIEPQTARKDVERRIQVLRRTQIRNTALRFRFQNVLLRYNTFSAHWMRICRQIEEGTYKHHLRKAKAKFDSPAAARDARARERALQDGDTEPPGPPSFEVDEDMDLDVDFEAGVGAVDDEGMRAALRSYSVPQDVMAPAVAARATPRGAMRDASLDRIDRGTEPAPPPVPTVPPPLPVRAAPAVPVRSAAPPLPGRAGPPPAPPPPPAPVAKPPPPLPAAKNAPPLPNRPGPPPPPPAKPPPPKPNAPPAAAKPQTSPAAPAARPVKPPDAPSPAAAKAARPVEPPTAASADERTRQIYSKYVETRKALGESTAAITMDSLAKSLRDSSEKLRQKHPGKTVDFDVQVKDGKTVLKPIVR